MQLNCIYPDQIVTKTVQWQSIKPNLLILWFKKILGSLLVINVLLTTSCTTHVLPHDRQYDQQQRLDNRESIRYDKAGQARLALGLAYLEQGNYKLANVNLQRAKSYLPDSYQVHLAIALYEQRVGEYDRAHESYRLSLMLAPTNPIVRSHYGQFLCDLGQYEQANVQFELALNPTSYDTIDGIVTNSTMVDRTGIADRTTTADRDTAYNMIADSFESAGYCYLKQDNDPQAQEFISRALQYEPVKSKNLLVTTEHYLDKRHYKQVAVLLDIYQQNLPITADILWLQIRFAALNGKLNDVNYYGQLLAKNFSQSEQYKQFLAHEY